MKIARSKSRRIKMKQNGEYLTYQFETQNVVGNNQGDDNNKNMNGDLANLWIILM
jgi:hypothetical protein